MEVSETEEAMLAWAAQSAPKGVSCRACEDLADGRVVRAIMYRYSLDADDAIDGAASLAELATSLAGAAGTSLDLAGISDGDGRALGDLLAHVLLAACNGPKKAEAVRAITGLEEGYQHTLRGVLHSLMAKAGSGGDDAPMEDRRLSMSTTIGMQSMQADTLSSSDTPVDGDPDELQSELAILREELQEHSSCYQYVERECASAQGELEDAKRFQNSESRLVHDILGAADPKRDVLRYEDEYRSLQRQLEHVNDSTLEDSPKLLFVENQFGHMQRRLRKVRNSEIDYELDLHKDEMRTELSEQQCWKAMSAKAKLMRMASLSREEEEALFSMEQILEVEEQYIRNFTPELDHVTKSKVEMVEATAHNTSEIRELEARVKLMDASMESNQSELEKIKDGQSNELRVQVRRQQSMTRGALEHLYLHDERLPEIEQECRELHARLDDARLEEEDEQQVMESRHMRSGVSPAAVGSTRSADEDIERKKREKDISRIRDQCRGIERKLLEHAEGSGSHRFGIQQKLARNLNEEVLDHNRARVDTQSQILQRGGDARQEQEVAQKLETYIRLLSEADNVKKSGVVTMHAFEEEDPVFRLKAEEITFAYERDEYRSLLQTSLLDVEAARNEAVQASRTEGRASDMRTAESKLLREIQGLAESERSTVERAGNVAHEEASALKKHEASIALKLSAQRAEQAAEHELAQLRARSGTQTEFTDQLSTHAYLLNEVQAQRAEIQAANDSEVAENVARVELFDRRLELHRRAQDECVKLATSEQRARREAIVETELEHELGAQELVHARLAKQATLSAEAELRAKTVEEEWRHALSNGHKYEAEEAAVARKVLVARVADGIVDIDGLEAAIAWAKGVGVGRLELANAEKALRTQEATIEKAAIQAAVREEAESIAEERLDALTVEQKKAHQANEEVREELQQQATLQKAEMQAAVREAAASMAQERLDALNVEREEQHGASVEMQSAKSEGKFARAARRVVATNSAVDRVQFQEEEELQQYTSYVKVLKKQAKLRDQELVFLEEEASSHQEAHDREKLLIASSLHRLGLRYGRLLTTQERIRKNAVSSGKRSSNASAV